MGEYLSPDCFVSRGSISTWVILNIIFFLLRGVVSTSPNLQVFNENEVLTYLLTPWSRVLLEKLTVNFAASQEIPRIFGTRKFCTVPTSARHPSKMKYYLSENKVA
jgi:hypothetical protein